MKTRPLSTCPSCGGRDATEVDMGLGAPLRKCTACGMVYASEFGEPEDIYVDGYLKGETDFGLDALHPIMQSYLRHCGDRRMAAIERATGGTGRMLDVGCGTGEVLAAAQRRGWDVTGVEPVKASADIAAGRGLHVRCALLEDSGLPEQSYDVVSAFHVLEHMTEGVEFLRLIARWAAPGGHVVIEVPNWRSVHRLRKGASWPNLRPLEHISHYAPTTLAATMERAGLEPRAVRTATYLWPEGQTLEHALSDLGQSTWRRWLRGPLVRLGEHDGKPSPVPTRAGWAVLQLANRAYDAARVGQVILAVARVPR